MMIQMVATLATVCFTYMPIENDDRENALTPTVISFGDTVFSADEMSFASSKSDHCTCRLIGNAKVALYGGDTEITAKTIRFKLEDRELVSITCTENVAYKEVDGIMVRAEMLRLAGGSTAKLEAKGNVEIRFGKENDQATLKADSVKSENGEFQIAGQATLRIGK